MAFKNAGGNLTASLVTQYTCPAGKEAVVHAIFITPLVLETTIDIKVAGIYIGKDIPIVAGGSLYYPKPANLEDGDTIQALCAVASDAEIFISVLEKDV